MFLLSCLIPFAFYITWKNEGAGDIPDDEDERCARKILDLEERLFNNESQGTRWPVIQLYRMLVVVFVDTFILNHIFKSLWFSAIFVAFLVHDWYRMPFQHQFLNHLQRISSACLFLANLCSGPSAFSSLGDLASIPNMDICLENTQKFDSSKVICCTKIHYVK